MAVTCLGLAVLLAQGSTFGNIVQEAFCMPSLACLLCSVPALLVSVSMSFQKSSEVSAPCWKALLLG